MVSLNSQRKDNYEGLVKALLLELNENPAYKFKLVFSIISVIPFLAFFYVLIYLWPKGQEFTLEISTILFLSIFTSLCGFIWGYSAIKKLFKRIILYAAKVKRSEQLKSELVASISHDFKTPISILKLSLSTMVDSTMGPINEKQKAHLECCQGVLEHMLLTITTLLDLYKIQAGMVTLKKELYDITGIIEKQLEEFKIMFDKKKIHLNKKIPKSGLYALVDKDKIVEVVSNLLSNAIKYTPENGSINVEAYSAGDFVRLDFINSGGEIPFDKLDTIFEKFKRLDSPEEGTGLGLAISKDIIEIHEGRIWAENLAEGLIKFSVILPKTKGAME